jgi:hypothetical protein
MVAQTLHIQEQLVERAEEAARLRQRLVERAKYEADLAQRRYLKVDPANRLVADVLESEWNQKLQALVEAQEAVERNRVLDQMKIDEHARQAMLQATQTFATIWRDPQTPARERKCILRLLIEDVTLLKGEGITAHIRFKGGAVRTLTIPLPPPFSQARLTASEVLMKIDHLIDACTDAEIATQLNIQGIHTYEGLPFTATHVSQLRRKHGMKNRYLRLREAGYLTAEELAKEQGVTAQTIWRWYRQGRIQGICYNDRGSCLFQPLASKGQGIIADDLSRSR